MVITEKEKELLLKIVGDNIFNLTHHIEAINILKKSGMGGTSKDIREKKEKLKEIEQLKSKIEKYL